MKFPLTIAAGILLSTAATYAQNAPPKWATDGPYLDKPSASAEVPLTIIGTKLYAQVDIGGRQRRFVVDTGSPSMIDAALASELDLPVVGRNQGRDSHGVIIESKIVQSQFRLGGIQFRKVPMFVADFSGSEVTKLFIGDGVLGSELLPLAAWQMDLRNSVLRFETSTKRLPFVRNATKVPLHSFGYPHIPYLDVRFAKQARSKAMFDTGSPTYFAISAADLAGARKAGGIGRTINGFGSAGGSLGGQAAAAKQQQAEIKTLSIGGLKLGRVAAVRRELSPSLIGANMLEHFVVTLDARDRAAYFKQYRAGPFDRSTFGFTLSFDKAISVATVWDHSPAQAAGLQAGLQLDSINGVRTELTVEGIQRAISAMAGQQILLTWSSGSARLIRKSRFLQK